MADIITLNIDSSTAWDLAVPSAAGILQQTSGTISELPAAASGFAAGTDETVEFTAIPSLELANFREGSDQLRPVTGNVSLPLNGNKLRWWLDTYTPEDITSRHLHYNIPDKQGWTYITDFTLHPYTPYLKEKNLPLEYYLHGRIRYDGKLELAFFSEVYMNMPSEVSIDLANISLNGGGELTTIHTLQYTCGNQTMTPLRIAGREEAESYMLEDGKLIMARCPIFLGTLMHSGQAIYETKTAAASASDSVSFWPVVNFLGHMWSYWGVIADNVLYIVGLPVYNGTEQGHVHSCIASAGGMITSSCYFPANVPPTMPCDFPYNWGIAADSATHFGPIEEEFSKFNSAPPASTKAIRDAYKKACNTQPYMCAFSLGWQFANHSMAITAAELLEDNIATSAASVQYSLTTESNTELSTKDSLSEGINMTGFLVGAEGGVYSTAESAKLVQCVDGYDNPYGDTTTEYQEYGWLTGVRYNDAGLKTDPSKPVLNQLDVRNNVTTGFVSIPAVFPNSYDEWTGGFFARPTAANVKQGWIVHAFNVLQQGNTYTIWTSSWDGSLRVLSDTTEDPYIDPPIPVPPFIIPGPGPGPGPTPVPPIPPPPPIPPGDDDDDDTEWTWTADIVHYIYHDGSNVDVTTISSPVTPLGRIYTFRIEVADYDVKTTMEAFMQVTATVTPGNAGSYIDGRASYNEGNLTLYYGVAVNTSATTATNLVFTVNDSNGALATAAAINVPVTCTIDATIYFNLCYITSSKEDFNKLSSSNVVRLVYLSENSIVIANAAKKTKTRQINKHYKINRATGNLQDLALGESLKGSLSSSVFAGTTDNTVGLSAPTVVLTTRPISTAQNSVAVTGPITINNVYVSSSSVNPQSASVTINNGTSGYYYDKDNTANGTVDQARGTTTIGGNATLTITCS